MRILPIWQYLKFNQYILLYSKLKFDRRLNPNQIKH
nr:MAG TPA: hypothetical protein [Caudoviricetes sp.]